MKAGRKPPPGYIPVYDKPFQPLLLRDLTVDCDISQGQLATLTGLSRPAINLCVNRGYIPTTRPLFRQQVESFVTSNPVANEWLVLRGLKPDAIWQISETDLKMKHPAGTGQRTAQTRKKPLVYQPGEAPIKHPEVAMLTQLAREHFKPLFRDPFPTDGGIEKSGDIYMGPEHLYLEAAIMEAAKNGGFMAVIAEAGGGKTVIRKKCIEQLKRDGSINVISPDFINCEFINSRSLLDAIIMDISSAKPKSKLEHKTRQVQALLIERAKEGRQSVLIIEEAHVLPWQTIRHLKRFYEMDYGWKRLLGIILIGQPELFTLLDEHTHPELREVIRRIQVAQINGLGPNIKEYLEVKFKRVGKKLLDIVTEEAIETLNRRLTTVDKTGRKTSIAYPLTVNNYMVSAMNLAAEMGESKVTAEVVEAI